MGQVGQEGTGMGDRKGGQAAGPGCEGGTSVTARTSEPQAEWDRDLKSHLRVGDPHVLPVLISRLTSFERLWLCWTAALLSCNPLTIPGLTGKTGYRAESLRNPQAMGHYVHDLH